MAAVTATRTELLQRRSRIVFARQGRDLIWDKRTALTRELRQLDVDIIAALQHLRREASEARRTLERTTAQDGPGAVVGAAVGAEVGLRVRRTDRTVAGVRIVTLDPGTVRRDPLDRGFAPALVSAGVSEVADAYELYLEGVLRLCALEQTVRRLAAEVARCTRQVNALENVVIPGLEEEARLIRATLDEREREEGARLRRARDSRREEDRGDG